MKRKQGQPEDDGGGVPTWIVSFADMVTLLLTFFVLLQAFAHEQRPELFYEGQGSFRHAIRSFGIPRWMSGKSQRIDREWMVNPHPAEPDDQELIHPRVVDPEEERIQQMFQEMKKRMENESTNLRHSTIDVTAMPIQFPDNRSTLTPAAKQYLDGLAVQLRSSRASSDSQLYVIGLAPKQTTFQRQWVLSAERAEVLTAYLRRKLSEGGRPWSMQAWGGGRTFGTIPHGTEAGIIVMGADYGG